MGVNAANEEGPMVKMDSSDESAALRSGEEAFWSVAVQRRWRLVGCKVGKGSPAEEELRVARQLPPPSPGCKRGGCWVMGELQVGVFNRPESGFN